MLDFILKPLADFVITIITKLGYGGIFLAMVIQSAGIPLPSEVTIPFTGFLVSQGIFDFWLATLSGTLGCLIGASIAYAFGYYGGEPLVRQLIKKYGKFVLISESDLDRAQKWFDRYDEAIIFFSRLLPVIRTFISLPAGIAQMNFKKFAFYTLVGSFISTVGLAFLGLKMGDNWHTLGAYFKKFDLAIVILGTAAVVWYLQHKLKKHQKHRQKTKTS